MRLYHISQITGDPDERSDSNARPERELEQAARGMVGGVALERADQALRDLKAGRFDGAAVLTP